MAVKDLLQVKQCLFICNGGSCMKKNADEITLQIRQEIKQQNQEDFFHTVRTKCIGRCDDAPVVMSIPDNIWFKEIQIKDIKNLIDFLSDKGAIDENLFLYQTGNSSINSQSIPTKYRKNEQQ